MRDSALSSARRVRAKAIMPNLQMTGVVWTSVLYKGAKESPMDKERVRKVNPLLLLHVFWLRTRLVERTKISKLYLESIRVQMLQ